jgi:hypothetical protein
LLAALLRWRGDCVADDALLSGRPRRRDGSHTGYRKPGDDLVPIMHAKLALLGHLQWQTEDALGNPDDIIWFTPQQLWISSANFTAGAMARNMGSDSFAASLGQK